VRGYVAQVFRSLQGEGPLVGELQVFLRLAGCSIRCPWCDTKESWQQKDHFSDDQGRIHANPVTSEKLTAILLDLTSLPRPAIALTGGEPLEQAPFLADLLPCLEKKGFQVHLETAGRDARNLEPLLPHLKSVSMDWKLVSLMGQDLRESHGEVLERLGRFSGQVVVKVVIGVGVEMGEVEEAVRKVGALCKKATVVLQPLYESHREKGKSSFFEQLLSWAWQFRAFHPKIRLLPQVHRFLGLP